MGKQTVRFKCHHCSFCCTQVVCLPTPYDVIRIVKATGLKPLEFLEFLEPDEITEVKHSDPTWLECGDDRYIMALKRDTKRGCYFLDKRRKRCSIYDARPILCRLFPFKLHETRAGKLKGFSLHKDTGCPRRQHGEVPVAPLYELYLEDCEHQEDYNDLVSIFNRRDYPGKKPQDFVDMFVIFK